MKSTRLPPRPTRDYLRDVLQTETGLKGEDWTLRRISANRSQNGWRAVYVGSHPDRPTPLALKWTESAEEGRNAFLALEFFSAAGVPTTRPVFVDATGNGHATEWMDAPSLVHSLAEASAGEREAFLREAGSLLRLIHSSAPATLGKRHFNRISNQFRKRFPQVEGADVWGAVRELERRGRRFGRFKTELVPLHWDFSARNVLASEEGLVVLDLGEVRHGIAQRDLANFLMELEIQHRSVGLDGVTLSEVLQTDRAAFFAGYGTLTEDHRKLIDFFIEQFCVARRFRHEISLRVTAEQRAVTEAILQSRNLYQTARKRAPKSQI